MAKIKVGFCCRHSGFVRVMRDLWGGNFDVRIRARDQHNRMIPPWQGDEDIYISTLHHFDMLDAAGVKGAVDRHGGQVVKGLAPDLLTWQYDGKKPLMMYCTNPLIHQVGEQTKKWINEPWFHTIGAEDCYHSDTFCPVEKFIPFSLWPPAYPRYRGNLPQCLIVQKHPLDRLNDLMGEWVQPEEKFTHLDQLMKDIPYKKAHDPNFKRFVRMYSEYRVLFYWSNSPYSIVLFEAMAAGIPIVALRTPWHGRIDPLSKYLPAGSIYTNLDEARERIRQYLREPAPAPVDYPNMNGFNEIRQEWLETLTEMVESHVA